MKHFKNEALCLAVVMFFVQTLKAQNIAINTTGTASANAAMLDIASTTTGLLIPRVSLTNVATYAPLTGTAVTSLLVYSNSAPTGGGGVGYYYWDGAKWVMLLKGGSAGSAWLTLGNSGTVDGTNFIGTTDNIPFNIRVNNVRAGRIDHLLFNTFFGYEAGNNSTTGNYNMATGASALLSNTTGYQNAATGAYALYLNTTGYNNTATGVNALLANILGNSNTATGMNALNSTTGNDNTANGASAMQQNTTGGNNTAIGRWALYRNVAGSNATAIGANAMFYANDQPGAFTNANVAVGFEALRGSTIASANTGNSNVAVGYQSLLSNTTGYDNVAVGYQALYSNTTGFQITAVGKSALRANTSGLNNAAFGMQALMMNTTGNYNSAFGIGALNSNVGGLSNTAVGENALLWTTSGSSNTAVGAQAGYGTNGVDLSQCTVIGAATGPTVARTNVTMLGYGIVDAQCTGNNQVCVGNTSIAAGGLRAAVAGWTAYSDARFKTNIQENVVGLDFVMKLKPVIYNVRPGELHKIWGTPDSLVRAMDFSEAERETRIGFIAQDVQKAVEKSGFNFPGIDTPKNEHEVYTLRYVDFIMPMVKAIQEQQQTISKQQSQITELKALVEKMLLNQSENSDTVKN